MTMEGNDMECERIQRLREASEWLLRLQRDSRTDETIDEWLCWCDAHGENLNTFQRLQQSWKDLDALKPHAYALRSRSTAEDSLVLASGQWKLRVGLAIAAGLGAITLAVALIQDGWKASVPPMRAVTAAQSNRVATLPDGSKMILGAQSRVNMNFDGLQRQLQLSKGEAYFKVKHDKERPFVVQAGEISVTAIGTAFDVRRDRDTVIITVEEGIVDVSSRAAGRVPATWRAEAGHQVTYSASDRSASIASVNTSAELAWRNGQLAYVREPLPSVVDDLNRYSNQKVVLEGSKVSELRFTGTAFASSVEDWATGIAQIYPVDVRRTASGEIVLRWRD
jgi:transmembrane sensor